MVPKASSSITLTLTPVVDSDSIYGLDVILVLQSPGKAAGEPIFLYSKRDNGTGAPSHEYHPSSIKAYDSQGHFPLNIVDSSNDANLQEWHGLRNMEGDLSLHLHVQPVQVTAKDHRRSIVPLGIDLGRTELLEDQGGLMGAGKWFIPRPAAEPEILHQITVQWDVSSSPPGTRAVWSHGEGPEPITKEGTIDMLLNSVYMVGPVQSFPAHVDAMTGMTGDASPNAGSTFWFGKLPTNLEKLSEYSSKIFPSMSTFFRDPQGSYQAFIRKVPNGFGGTGFQASSLIEYDFQTEAVSDFDLVRLFNDLMVRSWARLDTEDDDGSEAEWFSKGFHLINCCVGLSQMYTIFFPYRFGQRGPDYFRATLNGFLSAYYTSPHLTTRISQGKSPAQVDSYTASIPYNRGWIYMLKMDCYTRRASVQTEAGVLRPLDGVVGDLMEKRRSGLQMRTVDWLNGVAHWLDMIDIAAAPYFQETIMDGNTMWLDDMTEAFGAKEGTSRVVEVDQEMLYFGFDVMKSLERGVVSAIEPGSRANLSGLQDGDRILRLDGFEFSMLGPDREVKVLVERDGETCSFEYSPRGLDKVPCWQVLKVEPAGK
ncbi:hypothetical protein BDP81DRAFT_364335 [Colletotrichum phormii]|uniref:PDZ domain-containing protein n=1 Tax=Colletotrichum phormii TaxID=359342 RepID=A0AAJ0A880_9PEZI|nr:uncharacterized protein BDP81DRAFT_364335 [Colletotrichum phormii]KAK1656335.1 hypothetical protein BDP81DRAFT_364335 [Colletotrichum phormii]